MIVQFSSRYGLYNAGERADFTDEQAAALVGAGIANQVTNVGGSFVVVKPEPAGIVTKAAQEPAAEPAEEPTGKRKRP